MYRLIISIVVALLSCIHIYAQKPQVAECKIQNKEVKLAKYYTGRMERIQETLAIQIAVKPSQVNETDLVLIARHIKERFCKESKLVVFIFDDKKTARYYFDASFKESRDALRGEYVLDKEAVKEYVSFVRGSDYYNNNNKIRIELNSKNNIQSKD
jgi:hypothetical protein